MTIVVNNSGKRFKMVTVRIPEDAYLAVKGENISFSGILEDAIQAKFGLKMVKEND